MQSKKESLIETSLNIFTGFIFSLAIWSWVVKPIWNIETSMLDNLGITILFTISAIIRGYLWRRYFNQRLINKYITK
jgi:hypothetical protein